MQKVYSAALFSRPVRWKPGGGRAPGFSLVENLVTLFILSLGLLAVAGLQLESTRAQQSSHQDGRALELVQGLADRMRANLDGARIGAYVLSGSPPAGPQSNCLASQGCTPAQMALNDLWEWQQDISSSLPGGIGVVCLDSTPSRNPGDFIGSSDTVVSSRCDGQGSIYMIHVLWDRGARPDGRLELTADPLTSDGHFFMAFEP
ncbi:MAG: type IV pilus modification protein PilV [Kistimonas sp.]|nr:type IV pilus modification protein PilV [Kistimonas sp.]